MCGLSVYEIITDNRTYFSNDWNTTISDGFAIYTPVFVVVKSMCYNLYNMHGFSLFNR